MPNAKLGEAMDSGRGEAAQEEGQSRLTSVRTTGEKALRLALSDLNRRRRDLPAPWLEIEYA